MWLNGSQFVDMKHRFHVAVEFKLHQPTSSLCVHAYPLNYNFPKSETINIFSILISNLVEISLIVTCFQMSTSTTAYLH